MAKSEKTESTDISQPAVRRDFWEFLISRHPIEEEHATSTSRAYRWARMIPQHRLVVVQYVTAHGVGIFLRGERGENPNEVEYRLKPFAGQLLKILGAEQFFFTDHGAKYFFQRFIRGNPSRQANWGRMADWLHNEADAYQHAIQTLMGRAA